MWDAVSQGVSSETLKHKLKFIHKLTDNNKRPFLSTASAPNTQTR
jgi:hypothetical protein